MKNVLVPSQSQAEKDKYLFDCFHDSGFIQQLIDNDHSVIAGRTGAGKTAIARYVAQKPDRYSLFGAIRLSITSFTRERVDTSNQAVTEKILLFILLKSAKYLVDNNLVSAPSRAYWDRVFKDSKVQDVTDYQTFTTTSKQNSAGLSMGLTGNLQETLEQQSAPITSENIFKSLLVSFDLDSPTPQVLVFADDLSDFLEETNNVTLKGDISVIQNVITRLDFYNTELADSKKGLRFISCIRDDIFEWMEGSHNNKLRSNTLFLKWNEKTFASLLIRRLPYFQNDLDEALKDPVTSIRAFFPDEIFKSKIETLDASHQASKFYAYMIAVSFNRPRDFLAFCNSMKDRLGGDEVSEENIDSAEVEYTNYFRGEIKDELYLVSKLLNFPTDDGVTGNSMMLDHLIDLLAKKRGFNASQLREDLSKFLDEKTAKLGQNRMEKLTHNLWWYGLLGFQEGKNPNVHFKYFPNATSFIPEKWKDYSYHLHRGLWWFAQKRRGNRTSKNLDKI